MSARPSKAGLLGLSLCIFPRCPAPKTASTLHSLPVTIEDEAFRALESLGEPGCMMPSPAGSWAAWFILSFQEVGQGSREPHIMTVIRNLSPHARGRADGSSPPTHPLLSVLAQRGLPSGTWRQRGVPEGLGGWQRAKGKAHLSAAAGKALLPFCGADYGSVFQGHLCSSLACPLPRMHSLATES